MAKCLWKASSVWLLTGSSPSLPLRTNIVVHTTQRSLVATFATSMTKVVNNEGETTSTPKGIMMILSPAKTLDMSPLPNDNDSIPDASTFTRPNCHLENTKRVVQSMKERSQSDLRKLLSISDNLAKTTHQYWNDFQVDFDQRPAHETKPCIYAFSGAAYQGLEALQCSKEAIFYLQDNLRIVDGVYGLLRPLDRMQAYRLEMATRKIFGEEGPTKLNDFWKEAVTEQLTRELHERPEPARLLLNLASDEYAAAVDPSPLPGLVKVVFRQEGKVISIHAKRARGLMVRFVAEANAQTLDDVRKFDKEGYQLVEKESDETTIVFDRRKPAVVTAKKQTKRVVQETTAEPKKRGRKQTS